MRSLLSLFAVMAIVSSVFISSEANADRGGKHGKGEHGNKHEWKDSEDGDDDDDGDHKHHKHKSAFVRIGDDDRGIISRYLSEDYGANCPPGLAKKHNGCLPPGQAKKYRVGRVLSSHYEPVPDDLLVLLHPAPIGYQYVRVDKDVLLISEASKKVIDAITLLSAVGK